MTASIIEKLRDSRHLPPGCTGVSGNIAKEAANIIAETQIGLEAVRLCVVALDTALNPGANNSSRFAMDAKRLIDALILKIEQIPFYCRRCRENLAAGQSECPFCGDHATAVDE